MNVRCKCDHTGWLSIPILESLNFLVYRQLSHGSSMEVLIFT